MPDNPAVVEVIRGGQAESAHRGAAAVVDADGEMVLAFGDIERPIFPRSAVKPIQALALIESGAADRFSLSPAELALACASHSGEPEHVATAAQMLAKAGLGAEALACGAHWPLNAEATRALAREGGAPSALHNNCSGKHAGFICLACAREHAMSGYERAEHPVQLEVKAALEDVCGERLGDDRRGVDGCSIPTYAMPLRRLAHGFARFGTGQGLGVLRARASRRLAEAIVAHPFLVAGSGRFDTDVMSLFAGRVLTKTGAEGVFCASMPSLGLGLALKIDDGATRAAETAVAALIARFLPMDEATQIAFPRFARPQLRNWRGLEVGELRAAGPLAFTRS